MLIFRVFNAAERAPRGEPRLVRRQAAAAMLVFEERKVRVDFTRQIWFGPLRPNDVDEPLQ